MMRALIMDFANDKNALDINNEYMFGRSFLVCPVTEPMYVKTKFEQKKYTEPIDDFSDVKSAEVYLPASTKWIDFWTGETFEGGQTIKKETPINIMPLFVKAGAIIPLGPFVQHTKEKIDFLEIRIYPGDDGSFVLYDDEKDNYNYEKGQYSTIEFKWDDTNRTLIIGERQGEYPGMNKQQNFNIVIVDSNKGGGLGEVKADKTIKYKGVKMSVKL